MKNSKSAIPCEKGISVHLQKVWTMISLCGLTSVEIFAVDKFESCLNSLPHNPVF